MKPLTWIPLGQLSIPPVSRRPEGLHIRKKPESILRRAVSNETPDSTYKPEPAFPEFSVPPESRKEEPLFPADTGRKERRTYPSSFIQNKPVSQKEQSARPDGSRKERPAGRYPSAADRFSEPNDVPSRRKVYPSSFLHEERKNEDTDRHPDKTDADRFGPFSIEEERPSFPDDDPETVGCNPDDLSNPLLARASLSLRNERTQREEADKDEDKRNDTPFRTKNASNRDKPDDADSSRDDHALEENEVVDTLAAFLNDDDDEPSFPESTKSSTHPASSLASIRGTAPETPAFSDELPSLFSSRNSQDEDRDTDRSEDESEEEESRAHENKTNTDELRFDHLPSIGSYLSRIAAMTSNEKDGQDEQDEPGEEKLSEPLDTAADRPYESEALPAESDCSKHEGSNPKKENLFGLDHAASANKSSANPLSESDEPQTSTILPYGPFIYPDTGKASKVSVQADDSLQADSEPAKSNDAADVCSEIWYLRHVNLGVSLRLKAGEAFVIGSSMRECDYVISFDSSISRKHASLSVENGQVVVRDLLSTNQSYIDYSPLSRPAIWQPGQILRLGINQLFALEAARQEDNPS